MMIEVGEIFNVLEDVIGPKIIYQLLEAKSRAIWLSQKQIRISAPQNETRICESVHKTGATEMSVWIHEEIKEGIISKVQAGEHVPDLDGQYVVCDQHQVGLCLPSPVSGCWRSFDAAI